MLRTDGLAFSALNTIRRLSSADCMDIIIIIIRIPVIIDFFRIHTCKKIRN